MLKGTDEHSRPQIIEIVKENDLNTAFEIRKKVFVEEQQVSAEEEYDEYEAESRHFLLFYEGKACATGRFRLTDKGWKIERMAVLTAARGMGFGGLVLQAMLSKIPNDGRAVYLHAQEHALNFYHKHGFIPVGERFWEANIPHFRCVYS